MPPPSSPPASSSSTPTTNENKFDMSSISSHINDLGLRLSPIIRPNAGPATAAAGSNRNPSRPEPRLKPTTLTNASSNARLSPLPTRRQDLFNLPVASTNNSTSGFTEAKYQEVQANSGVFHIDGEKREVRQDEMTRDCLLGAGSCGQVFKMQHQPTKITLAVKVMPRSALDEDNKRIIMDLDVILKCHDCPHIVRCLGYFVRPYEVWICMEVMASCFEKLLKIIQQPIPESILGKLTYSTMAALSYLKDKHELMHRDVKPSNILIDEQGNMKLCDFGISGVLIDSKAKSRNAGCAAYMSPERISPPDPNKPDYDVRADIWSLGITLIELATNAYPYSNCHSDFVVMARIVQEDAPQLPSNLSFSDEFRSFVNLCLIKDYQKRPKYGALMEHPFFVRSRDEPVDVAGWYRTVTTAALSRKTEATR